MKKQKPALTQPRPAEQAAPPQAAEPDGTPAPTDTDAQFRTTDPDSPRPDTASQAPPADKDLLPDGTEGGEPSAEPSRDVQPRSGTAAESLAGEGPDAMRGDEASGAESAQAALTDRADDGSARPDGAGADRGEASETAPGDAADAAQIPTRDGAADAAQAAGSPEEGSHGARSLEAGSQETGSQDAELKDAEPPAAEPPEAPALSTSPQAEPDRAAPRRGGVIAVVISLIALLGVGALGWQVYELRQASKETRQEVAQRLVAGDTGVAEVRALTRQQHESIAALQGRFGALEAQVAASEGQAAALEAMYLEHSRSRADQVLAEVEQAINIAAQQLQLAGNFEAALIALQGAEARLALPELGHLQPLRRALLMDIDELKAHPQVDVSGLALRLEILLDRVDALPLAFEVALQQAVEAREQLEAQRENGEIGPFALSLEYARALTLDIWNELKGMVRLERLDQSEPVLLSPEQSTYLRENVKIRLLTARLALLARDGRTYAADLAQARGWIERFFDTRDERVQRVVADLSDLEQTPVRAEQPSLSETFAALRLLQARSSGARQSGAAPGNGAPEAADGSR